MTSHDGEVHGAHQVSLVNYGGILNWYYGWRSFFKILVLPATGSWCAHALPVLGIAELELIYLVATDRLFRRCSGGRRLLINDN